MKKIESYLHQAIPITQAMGVKVLSAKSEEVVLFAPLALNLNHQKTAFGGSLHTLATLSCWTLLYINLKDLWEASPQLVITRSEVDYLQPITKDFTSMCRGDSVDWERFVRIFETRGKARIDLTSVITQEGKLAVDYKGTFAALKNPS